MSGHEDARGVAADLLRVLDHPRHRAPDFADDLIHARRRRERVLDQRQVEAGAPHPLAEERVRLLVVHLPVAAVDVDERGRRRRARRKDVEPVARADAVAEVEPRAGRVADCLAALRPIRDVRVPLRLANGGRVVVRGIERRPVHPAIEHGAS